MTDDSVVRLDCSLLGSGWCRFYALHAVSQPAALCMKQMLERRDVCRSCCFFRPRLSLLFFRYLLCSSFLHRCRFYSTDSCRSRMISQSNAPASRGLWRAWDSGKPTGVCGGTVFLCERWEGTAWRQGGVKRRVCKMEFFYELQGRSQCHAGHLCSSALRVNGNPRSLFFPHVQRSMLCVLSIDWRPVHIFVPSFKKKKGKKKVHAGRRSRLPDSNKNEKRHAVKRCCVIFIYCPINNFFLLHSARTHLDFLLITFVQPVDCYQMSHEMNLSF